MGGKWDLPVCVYVCLTWRMVRTKAGMGCILSKCERYRAYLRNRSWQAALRSIDGLSERS